MFFIEIYTDSRKKEWDAFVKEAVNSHFLFYRNYMEYHSDRFTDHSLIIRKKQNGNIFAVLPACIVGDILYSHLGLTFGGFLYRSDMTAIKMLEMFDDTKAFLKQKGISTLYYKALPHIYRQGLSEEDIYALFRNEAELYRVDISSAMDYRAPAAASRVFKRNVKKGCGENLTLQEISDYKSFMNIVSDCLRDKYDTRPTHTAEELEYLSGEFPGNIELIGCYRDNELVAGAVVYKYNWVATLQYAFASPEGKEVGALQFMIDHLIKKFQKDYNYFVYGISTEKEGRYLNENLIKTKEYSGCRAVAYQFFKLDI